MSCCSCVLLYGLVLVVRRRVLSRHGGTFELSVRVRSSRAGRGWVLGLGRYREDSWSGSGSSRRSRGRRWSWERDDLTFVVPARPRGAEEYSLYAGHIVVMCTTPRGALELAMGPSALTGFLSWLEAGPARPRRP